MPYFETDFLQFFEELAANNEKSWFDENRARYEKMVKKPFANLVEELIFRVSQFDPDVQIAPKDAIFRINRDVRFSPDKRPYKTTVSAIISPAGRKDKSAPGFYLELSAHRTMLGGGAYFVEKTGLENIRNAIAANPAAFRKLISEKDFVTKYGEIRGETNKRLAADLQAAAEKEPLIFNKQFYFMAELPANLALRNDLADVAIEYFAAAQPIILYLREALR